MFQLVNQPYPINDILLRQLRKAILIGLFVGLFLLIFQPFGINLWETPHKVIKILGFGFISFAVTALNFIVLRQLIPRLFIEERWTVGREIIAIMANILLIAIANLLYLNWLLAPGEESGINWPGMILITFLVGFFPVVGLVLFNYIAQLKKYSQAAAELPLHSTNPGAFHTENSPAVQTEKTATSTLTLIADNEKDAVMFLAEDLLFIESSDNYCTVVHLKNEQVSKSLLRSSLSRLEKQVAQPHSVRCHRSYVVNLNRVERVTGNAQGYKLHLFSGQFVVPVARQYNETLIAELKAL